MDKETLGVCKNIVELLKYRAESTPDSMAYTFLKDGVEEENVFTYAELDLHARAIAATLGDVKGARALLIYPPGTEFVVGFFGALYAGAIPIPAPPPDMARLKRTLPRLKSIILDADASLMFTTSGIADSLSDVIEESSEFSEMRWLATDRIDIEKVGEWDDLPSFEDHDLAYLQYTSGSTSTPKGVMITHRNIMASSAILCQGFGYTKDSVSVTWMPYFHDYGLVDGILLPMYCGNPCYILSPLTFLRRPERWLEAMSKYGGTHTQGPNFGYEHCLRRISDDMMSGLDLSSAITFSNAGEPIRPDTVHGFIERFSECGLRPEMVCPAYGLAESTLALSAKTEVGPPVFCYVDNEAFQDDKIVELDPDDTSRDPRTVISCGLILDDVDIAIVDPETERSLPDGSIGEIWAGGETIGAGYWQRAEESEHTFRARLADDPERGTFLRTGDLGFILRGQLYFTGREKDLVIIAGVNHYPQDIEWTVQNTNEVIRTDHCVAFSVDEDGEEKLVVIAETEKVLSDWQPLLAEIRKEISESHGLDLFALQLIRRGSILKTSSGKLQRRGCKAAFLKNKFKTRFVWKKEKASQVVPSATPPHGKRKDAIENWLIGEVADQLGVPAADIDVNRPLAEYGLTSRAAVSVVGALEFWLGNTNLSSTLLWEYPTIASLTRYLHGEQAGPGIETSRQLSKREPLAVIGLSCRFPQAANPEAFWNLLSGAVDAITEVPAERWKAPDYFDEESGKSGFINNRHGGFIDQVDRFDAAFFGISPAEAAMMDPQQRLLLELAWESFESAGMDPLQAGGINCGVYIGISTNDYAEWQFADRYGINPYTGPGKSYSIAANRISYLFDLNGPSMAIDTACSSSLVALHQASNALHAGECSTALVGGVNLLLSPKMSIALSQARMLSPDGHCKPFDASADGYVRSEGGGMVLLKRLSDARRDGDQILALVRGSAVNQDGRSNGLTAPNGLAQQAVIRRALADSSIKPDQIRYVEAHGTGTPLGDPIEIRSIQQVLSEGRTDTQTCTIGSVKSNIGHLEAAAGIAGLIKVIVSLYKRHIPPNANFKTLNELIKIEGTPFAIADKLQHWPDEERIAGISSFGFGGANAHAILSAAPDETPEESDISGKPRSSTTTKAVAYSETKQPDSAMNGRQHNQPSFGLLPVSARTRTALMELASRYLKQLEKEPETAIGDFCYSAAVTRPAFEHRLMANGASRNELMTALKGLISGNGQYDGERSKVAWLFTGQGAQYTGMAKELYASEPIFKQELDACNKVLKPLLEIDLKELLWNEAHADKLDHTRYTQPAMFALQVSLARLLMQWGIYPNAVIGYSVGEYAAACIAGIMSVEDGLRLIAERGRIVHEYASEGAMAAIFSDEELVREIIAPIEGVELATLNGAAGQVVSGEFQAIEKVLKRCEAAKIETRKLKVSHAFHSALMDAALKPFEKAAGSVTWRTPQIPVLSNLTGAFSENEMSQAGYWVDHLRKPVLFGASMSRLFEEEYNTFVEIGPKPTMMGMASRFAEAEKCVWLPALRQGEPDRDQLLKTVGMIWQRGGNVDWKAFYQASSFQRIPLPGYPFERKRYWLDTEIRDNGRLAKKIKLLGNKIESPLIPSTLFQSKFSLRRQSFYGEHRVFGEVVVPAAGHVSLLLDAAKELYDEGKCRMRDLIFPQPLLLQEEGSRQVHLVVETEKGDGLRPFRLISFEGEPEPAALHEEHASGAFSKPDASWSGSNGPDNADGHPATKILLETVSMDDARKHCSRLETADFYEEVWQSHIQLGDAFRRVKSLWHGDGEVLVRLEAPSEPDRYAEMELFPGLLDAALQGLTALAAPGDDQAMVPFSLHEMAWYGRLKADKSEFWSLISIREADSDTALADVRIWEANGEKERLVAEFEGFRVRKVLRQDLLRNRSQDYTGHLYRVDWQTWDAPSPGVSDERRWLLFSDSVGLAEKEAAKSGFKNMVSIQNIKELVSELANGDTPGILFGLGLGLTGEPDLERSGYVVSVLMEILAAINDQPVPVVILTSGAQNPDPGSPCEPLQTALWSFGRVVQREMPHVSCRLVDLDASDAGMPGPALLTSDESPLEIVVRGSQFFQPRLVHNKLVSQGSAEKPLFRNDAGYLITGGLGKLGLDLAEWLVEQGAGRILLLGRNEPDTEQLNRISAMNENGSTVKTVLADVSNLEELKKAVVPLLTDKAPLKGIFHLAGVVDDGPLQQQSRQRIENVLAPKVTGSWNLHRLVKDHNLDHFVVFSSATSILGTAGQASYSMANGYMDGLIHERRANRLPGIAINWGPWQEGMGSDLAGRFKQQGIRMMESKLALTTVGQIIRSGSPVQTIVITAGWDRYTAQTTPNPMLQHLAAGRPVDQPSKQPDLAAILEKAPASDKRLLLEQHLREIIGSFLHIPDPASLPGRKRLFEAGLDSLGAVEVKNRIAAALGKNLRSTLLFDFPSIDDLTTHICINVLGLQPDESIGRPGTVQGKESVLKPVSKQARSGSQPDSTPKDSEIPSLDDLSDDELAALLADELGDDKSGS